MEEIIVAALQFIFETLLDILSSMFFDWPIETRDSERLSWVNPVTMFALGAALAGLSLLVFHHTIIAIPTLRIANLVLAPPASALLSQARAKRRLKNDPYVEPRAHFWRAFAFTLGLVAVRFAYAARA